MIVLLTVGVIKRHNIDEYFPEPKSSGGRVKVKIDLPNYATKADFKNAASVDKLKFAKKIDLASLKSDVDNIDIDKLKNVPTNLSNLKSKVNKLDVNKLLPVHVDLIKLKLTAEKFQGYDWSKGVQLNFYL